jgi:prophage maintenance system killer protein
MNTEFTKKDIIGINQSFDTGNLRNEASLDFALAQSKRSISWTKSLAFLLRAILIDHAFEEGNKRTACALMIASVEMHDCIITEKTAVDITKRIILKNMTSIESIQRMIEDGIAKQSA